MKSFFKPSLKTIVLVLVLLEGCTPNKEIQSNQTSLDGTWQVVTVGRQDPNKLNVLLKWKFHDGKVSIFTENSRTPISNSPYRLDENQNPKQIVMEIQDVVKETRHGIYSLDGDQLRINFTVGGGTAPKKFSPELDLVFKKISEQSTQ